MKRTILAFICGLLFSGILSVVIGSLHINKVSNNCTVYYLQTGVYKTKDNAVRMQLDLSEKGIEGYVYEKAQLYYVICGLETASKEVDKYKEILNQSNISFISKQIELQLQNKDQLSQRLLEVLSS